GRSSVSDTNHRPMPDIVEQAAGALRDAPVPAGPPAELAAATLAAINNRLAGTVPAEQVRRERRRRIMRYMGISTAAAVILGTAGVLWFGSSRAIALNDVIQKVKEAESVSFVETQRLGDQPPMEMTYSIHGPLVRIEGMGTVLVLDTKT